nr:MAG TPA: Structural protein [Caudoviricetes sp.]DAL49950.1 MAG TPA_asm: Structural protein [Caudoviricetes sp.]DAV04224.1 MAG TPA: Structural protein [Caudoviricetes sp.]
MSLRLFCYTTMGYYGKLASAIYNDVVSGLRGIHSGPTMSLEQLEDDIVDERLQIIKEYSLKGILPKNDLYLSINCIEVDCKDLDRCRCGKGRCETPIAHFEIPQLLNDYGELAVDYIGSTDRQVPFIYYTSSQAWQYHQYRKRGKFLPYVYIDITPNENNMYDCFIFNAPLIKQVSVVAIFKDPRQLEEYGCCSPIDVENMSFINNEIKKRLTEKKLRYYRQFAAPITPNDQTPK